MKDDDETPEEALKRLTAERAEAREKAVRAIHVLRAKAHDPFGVRSRIRESPMSSAGIAAAAGAAVGVVLALVNNHKRAPRHEPGAHAATGPAAPASAGWGPVFRDVAMNTLTPLVVQMISAKLFHPASRNGTSEPSA